MDQWTSVTSSVPFCLQAVCKDNGFFDYTIPSWFSTTKHIKTLSQRFCSQDNMLCSKNHMTVAQLGNRQQHNYERNLFFIYLFLQEVEINMKGGSLFPAHIVQSASMFFHSDQRNSKYCLYFKLTNSMAVCF